MFTWHFGFSHSAISSLTLIKRRLNIAKASEMIVKDLQSGPMEYTRSTFRIPMDTGLKSTTIDSRRNQHLSSKAEYVYRHLDWLCPSCRTLLLISAPLSR